MFYKKILFYLIFLIIVIIALFPRAVELISQNYLFLIDQGRDYVAVRDIVVNHKLTLIGSEIGGGAAGTQGIFQGPIYYYLLSIFFIIFNGNPYGGIVMMFLFSMLGVLMAYFVSFKIFTNKWAGLLTMFFVAVSHPLIDQARFVWNNHPSGLFILLSFYFVYLSRKGSSKFLFLAAFLASFIYNFEIAIAVPIAATIIIYSIFVLKLKQVNKYLIIFSGFLCGILPVIFFEVRHNFIGLRGILNYLLVSPQVYAKSNLHFNLVNNHITSFTSNLFDTFSLSISNPIIILFTLLGVLFFIFLVKEKNDYLKSFFKFSLLLLVVSFIIFSFLRNYVFYYYLYHLNVVYIFVATYLIYKMFTYKIHFSLLKYFAIILILILALKSANFSYANTFRDLKDYGGVYKVQGKIDAIDYIYKDAGGKPFGLLVFTPPVLTYPYDYLLWWYGERKYHYIPYQEKTGTFYLLIEPDPAKPWSYKGWLETVIKTGKIEYTKILPSGFIIQKRINET